MNLHFGARYKIQEFRNLPNREKSGRYQQPVVVDSTDGQLPSALPLHWRHHWHPSPVYNDWQDLYPDRTMDDNPNEHKAECVLSDRAGRRQ